MHEEVLSEKQKELLPLIASFSDSFGLIGGTAIALQLGHRRSIDFDLTTLSEVDAVKIRDRVSGKYKIDAVLVDETREYTLVINGVKISFISYPFNINFEVRFQEYINLPSLTTLASMKAYALGRRAKWKDYSDLYFVFKVHSITEIVDKAKAIFGNDFNEKLFREELSYFDDIDYTEKIDYMDGFEVEDEVIREKLSEISLQNVQR